MPASSFPPAPRLVSVRTLGRMGMTFGVIAVLALLMRHVAPGTALLARAAGWRTEALAPLWFLLAGIPYCAVGLPRQAMCLAAGLVFGAAEGLGLAMTVTGLGSALGYLGIGRLGGATLRGAVRRRFTGRLAVIGRALALSPFQAVLVLRLMPVGSALLVTAAAALAEVPLAPFLSATILGSVPQNLVFVLMGAGTRIGHGSQIALGLGLFVLSTALGVALMRRAMRLEWSPAVAADVQPGPDRGETVTDI
ncbi:TVP38/TMEM64 family protein [Acidomonas methanolica]|uniref:TVP38/TMEM64 family protein n=1 Tax=Acidomonas methanolica TaxID=437 RepID=UPI001C055ED4|nr:VTT domain-containing protein [Acidomonas methanolica]